MTLGRVITRLREPQSERPAVNGPGRSNNLPPVDEKQLKSTTMTDPGTSAVYGLVDPRDGRVRYVGATRQPSQRYASHLRDFPREDHPKCQWIRELLDEGYEPEMVSFGCFESRQAELMERRLMKILEEGGCALTNVRGLRPSDADERKHQDHSERMKRKWADVKAAGYRNLTEASTGVRRVVSVQYVKDEAA